MCSASRPGVMRRSNSLDESRRQTYSQSADYELARLNFHHNAPAQISALRSVGSDSQETTADISPSGVFVIDDQPLPSRRGSAPREERVSHADVRPKVLPRMGVRMARSRARLSAQLEMQPGHIV